MKAIGGFFELELHHNGSLFHDHALAFNSGSSALEYYLLNTSFKLVLIPYYTCKSVKDSLDKIKLKYKFYKISDDFFPIIDFDSLEKNTLVIYNDYFGLNRQNIFRLQRKTKNILIDASQSFFYQSSDKITYFNSVRKFFGVPDGGFLNSQFSKQQLDQFENLVKTDYLTQHLIKRVESEPEDAYEYYLKNEELIAHNPIGKMSELTKSLLKNVDFESIKKSRIQNFEMINNELGSNNKLKSFLPFISLNNKNDNPIPMCYPLLIENGHCIKNQLIKKKIFTPTFWPEIQSYFTIDCKFETELVKNLICLPIDQRYNEIDMQRIIEILNQLLYE